MPGLIRSDNGEKNDLDRPGCNKQTVIAMRRVLVTRTSPVFSATNSPITDEIKQHISQSIRLNGLTSQLFEPFGVGVYSEQFVPKSSGKLWLTDWNNDLWLVIARKEKTQAPPRFSNTKSVTHSILERNIIATQAELAGKFSKPPSLFSVFKVGRKKRFDLWPPWASKTSRIRFGSSSPLFWRRVLQMTGEQRHEHWIRRLKLRTPRFGKQVKPQMRALFCRLDTYNETRMHWWLSRRYRFFCKGVSEKQDFPFLMDEKHGSRMQ